MEHGGAVQFQCLAAARRTLCLLGADISQLGQGVDVLSIGFFSINRYKFSEQLGPDRLLNRLPDHSGEPFALFAVSGWDPFE